MATTEAWRRIDGLSVWYLWMRKKKRKSEEEEKKRKEEKRREEDEEEKKRKWSAAADSSIGELIFPSVFCQEKLTERQHSVPPASLR